MKGSAEVYEQEKNVSYILNLQNCFQLELKKFIFLAFEFNFHLYRYIFSVNMCLSYGKFNSESKKNPKMNTLIYEMDRKQECFKICA